MYSLAAGHMAKDCPASTKEQESTGNTTRKKDPNKGNTRQVTTGSSDHSDINEEDASPLSLLFSDFDGTVDTVRVKDKGSNPQYVSVEVQSVPTSGIIHTGADITIMGGELFKNVARSCCQVEEEGL